MKKFFKEFITFLKRGNAFDLAVGVIVGGAFQKIVSSLVNDIIMPLISVIGGVNVSDAQWVLKPAIYSGDVLVRAEIALKYGSFIQTIIDFIIIAFSIFLAIKVATRLTTEFKKAQKDITKIVRNSKKITAKEMTVANEIKESAEKQNDKEKK